MRSAPSYPFAVPPRLSAIWVWLRLCFGALGFGPFNPPRGGAGASRLYVSGRSARQLRRYVARPHNGRVIAPAFNLAPFRRFGRRDISPAQFLERLCRLSVWGRVDIYRLRYGGRRPVRRAAMIVLSRGPFKVPGGLWQVHIPPP